MLPAPTGAGEPAAQGPSSLGGWSLAREDGHMSSSAHLTDAASVPPSTDEEDRGFGLAIVWGSVFGITIFTLLVALVVKLVASGLDYDIPAGAIAAIAVWTGVWAGLFLGGTVAVGRWSMHRGH